MLPRVDLTDTEWMRLIDGDREDSDLPRCCANVSGLRDTIISLARNGGEGNAFFAEELRRGLTWVYPEHGDNVPGSILKMMEAFDIKPYTGDGIEDLVDAEYSRRHAKLKVEFG